MKPITDGILILAFLAGLGFLYQHYELGRYLKPSVDEASEAAQPPPRIVEIPQQVVEEVLQKALEGHQAVNCPKVASKALVETPTAGVYQWTDANGKVHFGDRHAEQQRITGSQQAQDLSSKYASAIEYLDLQITTDSATLPVFLRDKVIATVRQIFYVLTVAVPREQLRQVNFNLRIIATQDAFQQYKNQYAPELQTNTGFYLPKQNEAVVWQNRDEQKMLEVIKHEAAHLIMASLFGPTPTWLNEGFAEYVERLDVSGQTKKIDPNPHWWTQLRAGERPPLHDYFQYNGARWYQQDLDVMYSTAWSLLYFMMDNEPGRALFQQFTAHFIQHPCQMVAAETLIEQSYPGGITAFETHWQRWLQQRQLLAHYH